MLVVYMLAALIGAVASAMLASAMQGGWLAALLAMPIGASLATILSALALAVRNEATPETRRDDALTA